MKITHRIVTAVIGVFLVLLFGCDSKSSFPESDHLVDEDLFSYRHHLQDPHFVDIYLTRGRDYTHYKKSLLNKDLERKEAIVVFMSLQSSTGWELAQLYKAVVSYNETVLSRSDKLKMLTLPVMWSRWHVSDSESLRYFEGWLANNDPTLSEAFSAHVIESKVEWDLFIAAFETAILELRSLGDRGKPLNDAMFNEAYCAAYYNPDMLETKIHQTALASQQLQNMDSIFYLYRHMDADTLVCMLPDLMPLAHKDKHARLSLTDTFGVNFTNQRQKQYWSENPQLKAIISDLTKR